MRKKKLWENLLNHNLKGLSFIETLDDYLSFISKMRNVWENIVEFESNAVQRVIP